MIRRPGRYSGGSYCFMLSDKMIGLSGMAHKQEISGLAHR